MAGIPAPPSSTSGSPPPASPRRGQPAQPKIATANKEMSSLGLLSSASAHFFQPGFKLRNTSVCLVSARCQHFCNACSGATGRLMNSVGKTSRNNSISFFPHFTWNQGTFSAHILLEASGPRGQDGGRNALEPTSPFPHCLPLHMPHTQGKGQPMRAMGVQNPKLESKNVPQIVWEQVGKS